MNFKNRTDAPASALRIKHPGLQLGLAICILESVCSLAAWAQPATFTYQGLLTANGTPASGLYDLRFELFDSQTNGVSVGVVTNLATQVSDGLFTITLDFGDGVFDGSDRWLETGAVTNGGTVFEVLSPRQPIGSTPYAIKAADAMTVDMGIVSDPLFIGTTTNAPLDLFVNNQRALRLEDNGDGSDTGTFPDGAPNIIGGSWINLVVDGVVGATIAGGGAHEYGSVSLPNVVRADYTTIGGGIGNQVGSNSVAAVVSGGFRNRVEADSAYSAIGGGLFNVVNSNSPAATIGAGDFNTIGSDSRYTTIGGGTRNLVGTGAEYSTIGGGRLNQISDSALYGTIGGGFQNEIIDGRDFATVAGGQNNVVSGGDAAIGGGSFNDAQGSASAIGGGTGNTATATGSSVVGGRNNLAQGVDSTVGGGSGNEALSTGSTTGGGTSNSATGSRATVAGGQGNSALGGGSTVGGGQSNLADGSNSTVAGGQNNVANKLDATVSGGHRNNATGNYSSVVGGQDNTANSSHAFVGGGRFNLASDIYSAVAGGLTNRATADVSSVGGGWSNEAGGLGSVVSGGVSNSAGGIWSSVVGGAYNTANGLASTAIGYQAEATGDFSLAAGHLARAWHDGAVVLGNSVSTTNDQVVVSAPNGIGLGGNDTSFGVVQVQQPVDDIENGLAVANINRTRTLRMWVDGIDFSHIDSGPTGGANLILNQGGGNVGIGSTQPMVALHVTGDILATGSIVPNSDRNAKTDLQPVDSSELLERVLELPIHQWRFKEEDDDVRHVGPMAQDFRAAFGLGAFETAIATVDADGVALAAIQGLNHKLEQARAENAALRAELQEIKRLLSQLTPPHTSER